MATDTSLPGTPYATGLPGYEIAGVLQVLSHAAGHVDGRAGDVAGPVAGQEGHHARDLVGAPEPAERDLVARHLGKELVVRRVRSAQAPDVLPLRRVDQA